MNKTMRSQQANQFDKTRLQLQPTLPLLSKIQEIHTHNLQNIIKMLCQLINDFIKVVQHHDIQFTGQQLSSKLIVAIKEANNEIKYHQKINPIQRQIKYNVTGDIEQTLQLLAKLKIKQVQSNLPKMKKSNEPNQPSSFANQLSTITQKQSEQNLHNYLKMNTVNKRRSKSNLNKNYLFNTSSIEDIQFQVIREQTRKSLDNPYYKNNQTRKGLYNDLQKLKGQDNLLPAVKNYLQKHKKAINISKNANYTIQKLI